MESRRYGEVRRGGMTARWRWTAGMAIAKSGQLVGTGGTGCRDCEADGEARFGPSERRAPIGRGTGDRSRWLASHRRKRARLHGHADQAGTSQRRTLGIPVSRCENPPPSHGRRENGHPLQRVLEICRPPVVSGTGSDLGRREKRRQARRTRRRIQEPSPLATRPDRFHRHAGQPLSHHEDRATEPGRRADHQRRKKRERGEIEVQFSTTPR